jgi:hypothetical protein
MWKQAGGDCLAALDRGEEDRVAAVWPGTRTLGRRRASREESAPPPAKRPRHYQRNSFAALTTFATTHATTLKRKTRNRKTANQKDPPKLFRRAHVALRLFRRRELLGQIKTGQDVALVCRGVSTVFRMSPAAGLAQAREHAKLAAWPTKSDNPPPRSTPSLAAASC